MSEMNDKKQTLRDILIVSVGELICLGLIYGAFALLHRLDGKVLLGGALGALTAILNYFLLAVSVFSAADRAAAGDPPRKAGNQNGAPGYLCAHYLACEKERRKICIQL